MQKSKVTIIGAGIPGLSLSLLLAEAGIDICVTDKRTLPTPSDIKPSGRTTALMQGSIDMLKKAGVWEEIVPHACKLSRLTIIDDSSFPRESDTMVQQDFEAKELGQAEFGYNVPLGMAAAILVEKVKAHPNISVIEEWEPDSESEVLQGADLIVGADGRRSIVREWSGIEVKNKDYGQAAITCLISHSLPHNNTSTEFHRPGGPCTFVPYADNQSAVVWVEKESDAETFMALPKQGFVQALQERSRDLLGQIDLIAGPDSWPLMTLKADTMVANKTVLIAEAAHVLSPIGAQGLNLSLRDVDVLATMVINAKKTGQDIGSATLLKRYERRRMRDIGSRHFGVDMLNQMVASDNPMIRGARRLGLRALGLGGPLRHLLMKEGLSPRS